MKQIKLNITQSVGQQIDKIKLGKLFSYQEFINYADHSEAVIKAVSRNAKMWGLVKVKKGLFYRSENGRFGPMVPNMDEAIRYFTFNKQKTVGYVTGPALYYRWGLTTQVPAEVNVAISTAKKEKINISGLRVTTVPARYKVTKKNTSLLQFLDVMKNIDRIPNTEIDEVSNKLAIRFKNYTHEQVNEIEDIAIKVYNERTKALLGSFIEEFFDRYSEKLQRSLNPTSKYTFSYSDNWKNATAHWNLIQT